MFKFWKRKKKNKEKELHHISAMTMLWLPYDIEKGMLDTDQQIYDYATRYSYYPDELKRTVEKEKKKIIKKKRRKAFTQEYIG